MKIPATERAFDIRRKLVALVERGVNGEKLSAQRKLYRIENRFDFSKPVLRTEDIFSDIKYERSPYLNPVCTIEDMDAAISVKWAIEHGAGIPCAFKNSELNAQATPATASNLREVAHTLVSRFTLLWKKFSTAPGVVESDRPIFYMGLYDGMMNEQRPPGTPLPKRASQTKPVKQRKKKGALTAPLAINLHPYSVATELGKEIRFNVPLEKVMNQLDKTIKGEIAE